MFPRPLIHGLETRTLMLNLEIRPRFLHREFWSPVICHDRHVCATHDDVAKHIDTVIYEVRMGGMVRWVGLTDVHVHHLGDVLGAEEDVHAEVVLIRSC